MRTTRVWRVALAPLAASVIACTSAAPDLDASADDAGMCQVPEEGCPCSEPGAVVCSAPGSGRGVSCFLGVWQTYWDGECAPPHWGPPDAEPEPVDAGSLGPDASP
jgi:hypothetical protein